MHIKELRKKRTAASLIDLLALLLLDACIVIPMYLLLHIPLYYAALVSLPMHLLYGTITPLTGLNATPGMYLQKLCICKGSTENAGAGALLLRAAVCFFSCLPLGFGFWFCVVRKDTAALYDMASGTSVQSVTLVRHNRVDPHLVCVGETLHGSTVPIGQDGLLIGRDPAACTLTIPAETPCVSRVHCQARFNAQTGMLLVKDLGSSYGTFLSDGTQLKKNQTAFLSPGQAFYLGSPKNQFMLKISAK